VGSITVASVDAKDGTPVQMSAFSSYGPVSSSRPVVGRIEN
jgi:hypothetical protein